MARDLVVTWGLGEGGWGGDDECRFEKRGAVGLNASPEKEGLSGCGGEGAGCEWRIRHPSRLSGSPFARNRTIPLRPSSSRPVRAPESPVIRSRRDPILIDLLKLNGASIIFTFGVMAGKCSRYL